MNPLVVYVAASVPEGIRGAMNQWLLEVLPGVFVGRVSARVRDYLWDSLSAALDQIDGTYAALIYQSNEVEQGFAARTVGEHNYELVDFDGLMLVTQAHHQRGSVGGVDPKLRNYSDPW